MIRVFMALMLAVGAAAWISHSCPMAFFNTEGVTTQIVRYCY